jgi:hypothetical protein
MVAPILGGRQLADRPISGGNPAQMRSGAPPWPQP